MPNLFRFIPVRRTLIFAAIGLAASIGQVVYGDERLKGIACRSVHLGYAQKDPCTQFANEVLVRSSAPGSYFMVCGWDKGYFGIQELADGKKLILFSVWDSEQNDPGAVEEDRKVRMLYKDPAVRVGRFGGEGTGGQSFFDFDWQLNTPYRFAVAVRPDGKRSEYSGFFYHPDDQAWRHLITFSTVTGGSDSLRGLYTFVEDFRRNRESTKLRREALFGPAWSRFGDESWKPLLDARFTADANPVENIRAEVIGERLMLATGGDAAIGQVALRGMLSSSPTQVVPEDLPLPNFSDDKE
ncbi:MAG: DUF3472 domain-containing protein [Pirellulaceae bacterium]|jgi:hypothetical protein